MSRKPALRLHYAHRAGDAQPVCELWKGLLELQHDVTYRVFNRDTELQQPFARRTYLRTGVIAGASGKSLLRQQHVGSGRQQHAKVVGHGGHSAGAVAAPAADAEDYLVQVWCGTLAVGHDGGLFVLRIAMFHGQHLRLAEHTPPATFQALCLLAHLDENTRIHTVVLRPLTHLAVQMLGTTLQNLISGIPEYVADPRVIRKKRKRRRSRNPVMVAHQVPALEGGQTQTLDHPVQERTHSLFGRRSFRSAHVAERVLFDFSLEGGNTGHRKTTQGVVVAVEEGQHGLGVIRIERRVSIDGDVFMIAAPDPLAVPLDHISGQLLAPAIELGPAQPGLKPRMCRLLGKRRATLRARAVQQMVDRNRAQAHHIIAFGVAAGDAKQSLPNQVPGRVLHVGDRPPGARAGGQSLGPSELFIAHLQQNRARLCWPSPARRTCLLSSNALKPPPSSTTTHLFPARRLTPKTRVASVWLIPLRTPLTSERRTCANADASSFRASGLFPLSCSIPHYALFSARLST